MPLGGQVHTQHAQCAARKMHQDTISSYQCQVCDTCHMCTSNHSLTSSVISVRDCTVLRAEQGDRRLHSLAQCGELLEADLEWRWACQQRCPAGSGWRGWPAGTGCFSAQPAGGPGCHRAAPWAGRWPAVLQTKSSPARTQSLESVCSDAQASRACCGAS